MLMARKHEAKGAPSAAAGAGELKADGQVLECVEAGVGVRGCEA